MVLMGIQYGKYMEEVGLNRRSIAPDNLDCDNSLLRAKLSGQCIYVVIKTKSADVPLVNQHSESFKANRSSFKRISAYYGWYHGALQEKNKGSPGEEYSGFLKASSKNLIILTFSC